MSSGEDRFCPYTDVLLHLNGFCGHRVVARVAYEYDEVFRIEGILEHVPVEGMWANYGSGSWRSISACSKGKRHTGSAALSMR
jgi:hypothetical protein